ncbi:MAG: hypothetical protein B7O98_09500 [Zestosphaera tikiterensis]|uniref:Holin n=1 Tax=Zestosphaera tikiterensis TaxID=1973259 RepID=A0A2R7Y3D1_9CREN|nr:MAG: hypothetical protein B7O98_09500 [Zestosphaera tikiterensis]
MNDLLLFIVNGTLGAFLNVLMWSKAVEDLKSFKTFKLVFIGALTGYIYWWAHSEYNIPNGLLSIMAGYTAEDFLEWIMEKVPWHK